MATIRSEQPASTALPAKQRPCDDRDPRHQPREPRPEREGARVERRDHRVVGVPRPAAAALGEEHRGQPHPLDQLEQPVLLAVPERPLRPGQHRVVVGEDRAAGALAEELAVHRRGAADEAVGGVRAIRSSSSRRPRWAAIAKRPYSTKLPASTRSARFSRAVRAARRVAPLHRLGPRRVLGQRPPRPQLGEVGALGAVRLAGHRPSVSLFRAARRASSGFCPGRGHEGAGDERRDPFRCAAPSASRTRTRSACRPSPTSTKR